MGIEVDTMRSFVMSLVRFSLLFKYIKLNSEVVRSPDVTTS